MIGVEEQGILLICEIGPTVKGFEGAAMRDETMTGH
jgi:hypothetical protein